MKEGLQWLEVALTRSTHHPPALRALALLHAAFRWRPFDNPVPRQVGRLGDGHEEPFQLIVREHR